MRQSVKGSEVGEQLAENREQLIAILESTGDGLLVVGNKGKVILANRQFARMWQIPDELLQSGGNKLLLNVMHQLNDAEAFLKKVRHLYLTNEEDFDTLSFKDGRVFEQRYSRPLVKKGEIIGRIWSFRDVTEKKKVEEALVDSEQRFRTLFEQAAVGAAIFKAKSGLFLEVNPKFCDIVGYSKEELLRKTFMDITHPDDLEVNTASLKGVEADEISTYGMEKRYIRKDGTLVWVTLAVAPMWKQGEAPSIFVAIIKDITDRKRAEEMIHYQNAILEGVNRIFREALVCETEYELVTPALRWSRRSPVANSGSSERSARMVCCTISASAILAGEPAKWKMRPATGSIRKIAKFTASTERSFWMKNLFSAILRPPTPPASVRRQDIRPSILFSECR